MTDDPRTPTPGAAGVNGGYAYRPGDAPAYWNFGTYWRLLATSDATAGRSTTFDELFPRGLVAPPHVHDHAEEAFFVLEGDLVFTLGEDDQEVTAPARHLHLHPPGHPARLPLRVGRRSGLQHPGPRRVRPRHHRPRHPRPPDRHARPRHLRTHRLAADRPRPPTRRLGSPRRGVLVTHRRGRSSPGRCASSRRRGDPPAFVAVAWPARWASHRLSSRRRRRSDRPASTVTRSIPAVGEPGV